MKLSKPEINLLKDFSKMSNEKIICRIYGDIIFETGKLLAESDKEPFELEISNNTVTIKSITLKAYLENKLGMNQVNINEFDWADYINLNYIELQVKGKKYDSREVFFNDYFTIAFRYYNATALTIIYRTKSRIYTALYFKQNKRFYYEYVVLNDDKSFRIVLINYLRFLHLENRIKDLSFLAITPNYETPHVKSYLAQLNTMAAKSNFKFEM